MINTHIHNSYSIENQEATMFKTVNIRGIKFDVSDDTLNKMSYFEDILSRCSTGDIFIDRCPESFKNILDFLVYGVFTDHVTEDEFMRTKTLSDINYYGVPNTAMVFIRENSIPVFNSNRRVNTGRGTIDISPLSFSFVIEDIGVWKASLVGDNKDFGKEIIKVLPPFTGYVSGDPNNKLNGISVSEFIAYVVENDGVCVISDFLKSRGFTTGTQVLSGVFSVGI